MRRLVLIAAMLAAPALAAPTWAFAAPYPTLTGKVQMRDTQTIEIDGKPLRLAYIQGASGPLAAEMQAAIEQHGDIATCYPLNDGTYVCSLPDGEDVATLAVMDGFARAAADAPQVLRDAQNEASAEGYGMFAHGSDVQALPVVPPVTQYPVWPQVVTPDYATPPPPPDYYSETAPPTVYYEDEPFALVFGGVGLGWGFYDHAHRWHPHVPPQVVRTPGTPAGQMPTGGVAGHVPASGFAGQVPSGGFVPPAGPPASVRSFAPLPVVRTPFTAPTAGGHFAAAPRVASPAPAAHAAAPLMR
jgi:hypothetical protein